MTLLDSSFAAFSAKPADPYRSPARQTFFSLPPGCQRVFILPPPATPNVPRCPGKDVASLGSSRVSYLTTYPEIGIIRITPHAVHDCVGPSSQPAVTAMSGDPRRQPAFSERSEETPMCCSDVMANRSLRSRSPCVQTSSRPCTGRFFGASRHGDPKDQPSNGGAR